MKCVCFEIKLCPFSINDADFFFFHKPCLLALQLNDVDFLLQLLQLGHSNPVGSSLNDK